MNNQPSSTVACIGMGVIGCGWAAHFLGQGYTRYWDAEALVPWLYNAATGIWIGYDDPESLAIKSDYIVAEELGGAMYWELSSDTADAELLSVVYETLAE